MITFIREHRKIETAEERTLRLEAETHRAIDRASSEEDIIDAMVRRSIRLHGA